MRAETDRAALLPLPERPYTVCERHLRVAGKGALVSFEASRYSVPWTAVLPHQRLELRVTPEGVAIWSLGSEPRLLAGHPRARVRGSWVVDEAHWDGLPDGRGPQACPAAVLPEPLPDDVLASAILDRLLHHAEVISINGPSYRLKERMLEQREGGDGRLSCTRTRPLSRDTFRRTRGDMIG